MVLSFLPLVGTLLLLAPVAAASVSPGANLAVTRVAVHAFGDYVGADRPRKHRQRDRLRAAHVGVTHRLYASKTLLYAAVAGVSGSVLGVYVAAATLALLRIGGEAIRTALPALLGFLADLTRIGQLTVTELFPLLLLSSATVGVGSAVAVYLFRWEILDQRAHARATQIEATLPRTVAFVYALSRSGMALPAVLETLSRNEDVYGEAARELGVAVRDMNTFGTDVLTALEHMAERTPSQNMAEFGENLASVLGSGQELSAFLRDQYERYQEEAESQQEQYLELISTFAEAYVTVLVAGPLFFITILVVIGIVLSDTLPLLRAVVYLAIPLASFGFVVYIDSITRSTGDAIAADQPVGDARLDAVTRSNADGFGDGSGARTDGGATGVDRGGAERGDRWAASRERLAAYDRIEAVLDAARRPAGIVLERPELTALLTVPVGLWWVWMRTPSFRPTPTAFARAVDSPVIEAALLVLAAYGLAYEIEKRRIRAIERAVPDFLDRMASVNDAGVSVIESLRRLTRSDLGRLTPELERTWRDVQWGATVTTALDRFRRRVHSPMVSRAIALVTNAVDASGDVAPVLEIAADEARSTRRLRRERRQVMVTYLLVIYVSFAVFLGIIGALTVAFIPAVEGAQLSSPGGVSGVSTGVFEGIGGVDTDSYVLIFYHASAIQAVASGLIAGQLGEGNVSDGVKHATVMLLLAYLTFVIVG
ncbi:type II secretion system F family protein [Halobaculum magnesiiphilum]|uniref:Type II secretion system F family protein n=1 Tax=Halobaculum magnesiiphilum TaxID=1017351 RepID=A0A8T8WD74_9EURY|nr:type II secretion system F family protein [Halobaculum magnesiiphilum]QZP37790.1 type II secretion system F family protein [Halobaculum magnesiiphilum]